jgi:hypothetical protein
LSKHSISVFIPVERAGYRAFMKTASIMQPEGSTITGDVILKKACQQQKLHNSCRLAIRVQSTKHRLMKDSKIAYAISLREHGAFGRPSDLTC